jgi:hypothetical protein
LEGISEVTVSPGFGSLEEELSEVEEFVEAAALARFLPFRGNFLENPAGTSRSTISNSPRLRISSRMMKLDLHEYLDQNGKWKDLKIGSLGLIESPGACFPRRPALKSLRVRTVLIIYA